LPSAADDFRGAHPFTRPPSHDHAEAVGGQTARHLDKGGCRYQLE
jgi:hypothetical protein